MPSPRRRPLGQEAPGYPTKTARSVPTASASPNLGNITVTRIAPGPGRSKGEASSSSSSPRLYNAIQAIPPEAVVNTRERAAASAAAFTVIRPSEMAAATKSGLQCASSQGVTFLVYVFFISLWISTHFSYAVHESEYSCNGSGYMYCIVYTPSGPSNLSYQIWLLEYR